MKPNMNMNNKYLKMKKMHVKCDNCQILLEPQAVFNRIGIIISYDLIDGLFDEIHIYEKRKIVYIPSYCYGDLDVEEIKRKWG